MNNVVVIPPLSTNPVTPLAGTVAQKPAPAAHVATGQTAAATTGLTVATSLPAQLQAQTPIYDSSYPPAGQPGGH